MKAQRHPRQRRVSVVGTEKALLGTGAVSDVRLQTRCLRKLMRRLNTKLRGNALRRHNQFCGYGFARCRTGVSGVSWQPLQHEAAEKPESELPFTSAQERIHETYATQACASVPCCATS